MVSVATVAYVGWSICLGELELFNPSVEIITLSETNSIGFFHFFAYLTHLLPNFYYTQKLFYVSRNSEKIRFTISINITYLLVEKCFLGHHLVKQLLKIWSIVLPISPNISDFKKWISVYNFLLPIIMSQKICWMTCFIIIFCKEL